MKTGIQIAFGFVFWIMLNLSVRAGEMPEYTRTDYPLTERARFAHVGSLNGVGHPDVIINGGGIPDLGLIRLIQDSPDSFHHQADAKFRY